MVIIETFKHHRLIRREEVRVSELDESEICKRVKKVFDDGLLNPSDIRRFCIRVIVQDIEGRTEYRISKFYENGIEIFKY